MIKRIKEFFAGLEFNFSTGITPLKSINIHGKIHLLITITLNLHWEVFWGFGVIITELQIECVMITRLKKKKKIKGFPFVKKRVHYFAFISL